MLLGPGLGTLAGTLTPTPMGRGIGFDEDVVFHIERGDLLQISSLRHQLRVGRLTEL